MRLRCFRLSWTICALSCLHPVDGVGPGRARSGAADWWGTSARPSERTFIGTRVIWRRRAKQACRHCRKILRGRAGCASAWRGHQGTLLLSRSRRTVERPRARTETEGSLSLRPREPARVIPILAYSPQIKSRKASHALGKRRSAASSRSRAPMTTPKSVNIFGAYRLVIVTTIFSSSARGWTAGRQNSKASASPLIRNPSGTWPRRRARAGGGQSDQCADRLGAACQQAPALSRTRRRARQGGKGQAGSTDPRHPRQPALSRFCGHGGDGGARFRPIAR